VISRATGGALVTILINNYNYGRFLGEAIDSALNQTYSNIEVIVVDDGSTDSSREVIASYGDRIVPILKDNGGQASAFNAGFAASHGQWVFLLDSDDVFLSDKTERILDLAEQSPQAGLIAHNLEYCDARGVPINFLSPTIRERKVVDDRELSQRGRVTAYLPATSGLCFRRGILREILPMPEGMVTADAYLKVVALSLTPALQTPARLAKQRIHGENFYTGTGDRQAGEAGKLLHALGEAQVAFELKRLHPRLNRLAWKRYGRILYQLTSAKSGKARAVKAEIRSRYSVLDRTLASLFNVGGAYTKAFVRDLLRRASEA
jgi:glycosyltransferase involved in cell wall biosynthesis